MAQAPISLRDKIKSTVRTHLIDSNGLALGQCLTAVGWVGGTLPELFEDEGMVEISMADVANGGFAVGMALAGRRPIYVIRYQGFNWFNAPIIINYAAKSKEIWGIPCPLFIRSIAMEGGIGPVAGSSHHALYFRMPGIKICSPMSPNEFQIAYESFMGDDQVYYVSEHRKAYDNTEDLEDIDLDDPQICLFPISITRFEAIEAAKELNSQGYRVCVFNIFWIKPLVVAKQARHRLNQSQRGIVLDDDYVDGISKQIAFDLSQGHHVKMDVMGLEDRSAGFSKHADNLPPTKEQIMRKVKAVLDP